MVAHNQDELHAADNVLRNKKRIDLLFRADRDNCIKAIDSVDKEAVKLGQLEVTQDECEELKVRIQTLMKENQAVATESDRLKTENNTLNKQIVEHMKQIGETGGREYRLFEGH